METKKKVLLIEPDYKNKFPPVGLMKLATYYRNRGDWEVVFYKGDLRLFVIERICDKLVMRLNEIETNEETDWRYYKHELFEYIKTRKNVNFKKLPLESSDVGFLLEGEIYSAKDYYWKGLWEKEPEWDRVGVTTLFTFYWDKTIETIEFAKKLVKDKKDLMIGGVLASIQPNEIEKATGIKPRPGLLNKPGDLDADDTQIIDELELDYSILDEIDYQYPMSNAYYRYTTRGCIRKCPFCAVSTLEPVYCSYIPLKERIERVKEKYGEQKDLLLMDNNVLASENFEKIIQEIYDSGFRRGAKFCRQNLFDLSARNLKKGVNDRAYTKKLWRLIQNFYTKVTGDESYTVYRVIEKYHLVHVLNATKENVLSAYEELKDLYASHFNKGNGQLRFVDFNQGVDARLFTSEKTSLLAKIAIHPLRIAFDDLKTKDKYIAAIKMSKEAGMKDFSNYILYNFHDKPDELYERLKINVDLCEELKVSIYSFPMKYHPIRKTDDMTEDFSHNRDYIGEHWNRKYIRAIQAILNSTKGKIGRGKSYFEKAFGENIDEFHKLLEMPETMIIYRFFFDWLGMEAGHNAAIKLFGNDGICQWSSDNWWNTYKECEKSLSELEWNNLLKIIHANKFSDEYTVESDLGKKLLSFYEKNRKVMVEKDSDLFRMKQVYDANPIIKNKLHGRKK